MSTFVVDKGITTLFDQINEAAPDRSKASDGTIGDTAHQAQGAASQHNPEHPPPPGNPDNQVDAGDYTHDPAHGADMKIVSEAIRQSKDNRVLYIIFNKRIFSGPEGPNPFIWRSYSGDDPHTNHMHVSVRDVTHDQTQPWKIGIDMPSVDDLIAGLWRAKVPGTHDPVHPEDRTLPQLLNDLQIRVEGILETTEALAATVKVLTETVTTMKTTLEAQAAKEVPSGGAPGA